MRKLALTVFAICSLVFSVQGFAEGEGAPQPQQRRGGGYARPLPEHGHFDGRGGYVAHPGYNPGWHYDYRTYRPFWYPRPGVIINFAPFQFGYAVPQGYWQCTAFNQYQQPITDIGRTADEAAFAALYTCAGGPNYAAAGCFIPDNYCRFR